MLLLVLYEHCTNESDGFYMCLMFQSSQVTRSLQGPLGEAQPRAGKAPKSSNSATRTAVGDSIRTRVQVLPA